VASEREHYYCWRGPDLLLYCQLQPQANRDEFVGVVRSDPHGERLKIRIKAPPLDGRANARLITFLAGEFGVAQRAVHIESGATGRLKTVLIERPSSLPSDPALLPSIAPPPATL
jgi:uncharacterized protein (TIGR00251 family)